MRNKITVLVLTTIAFFSKATMALADSVSNVTEVHTSTSKTESYTVLGMDQTTGIIVIVAGVVVLLLIIMMATRSSRRTSSSTTVVK